MHKEVKKSKKVPKKKIRPLYKYLQIYRIINMHKVLVEIMMNDTQSLIGIKKFLAHQHQKKEEKKLNVTTATTR